MRRNLYKKFQKENKIREKYDEKIVVEKSKTLKIILSFITNIIEKFIRIIFYILIVALCSIGATYLFNTVFNGGILWLEK